MVGYGSEGYIINTYECNLPLEINMSTVYALVDDEKPRGSKNGIHLLESSLRILGRHVLQLLEVILNREARYGVQGEEGDLQKLLSAKEAG